ncbi:accessibility complex 1-like [Octopus vulgaris]|uniref:Accessibility complex 1-like n=3 Tax=Octopus TaxID=6643 RepID=A0AA36ANV7_OCTVU|nr:chromatin accessibility complex protein 1 [Octopus bimaculoides]XP_029634271.1 chromatin accessibility complex protein 1 [Octopus sinensis]CAI9718964.1 accessibility complex 1-like [Octopus vulgaris]|eukprot:XP_014767478.1 PREDICTED: chromatin accessibility complex protein 1-like [Octopus bimaculoides]
MADKNSLCALPLSRVKTIMKSSPDVSSISQEALFLTGKATEFFVQNLARVSLTNGRDGKQLQYGDLAEVVNTEETLQFLQDIIPRKIKASDYFEILKEMEEDGDEC